MFRTYRWYHTYRTVHLCLIFSLGGEQLTCCGSLIDPALETEMQKKNFFCWDEELWILQVSYCSSHWNKITKFPLNFISEPITIISDYDSNSTLKAVCCLASQMAATRGKTKCVSRDGQRLWATVTMVVWYGRGKSLIHSEFKQGTQCVTCHVHAWRNCECTVQYSTIVQYSVLVFNSSAWTIYTLHVPTLYHTLLHSPIRSWYLYIARQPNFIS